MFQRDEPDLCRGMVCQKSRKSKQAAVGGAVSDDLASVSSASTTSTMGTRLSASSGEKRPYSSTVTVSTAGGTASHRILPCKKQKNSVRALASAGGVPAMISHCNHPRAQALASSVTESDATSDNRSVCSGDLSNKAPRQVPAETPSPVVKSSDLANSSETHQPTAMEALIGRFQERHRALRQTFPPVVGAVVIHATDVFAATVDVPEEKEMPATVDCQAVAQSATDAARSALYKAYLQALSGPAP